MAAGYVSNQDWESEFNDFLVFLIHKFQMSMNYENQQSALSY